MASEGLLIQPYDNIIPPLDEVLLEAFATRLVEGRG